MARIRLPSAAQMRTITTKAIHAPFHHHVLLARIRRQRPLYANNHQTRTLFYLPTILQPAFWRSLIPTFLRRDRSVAGIQPKKPRNPATFFIWMSMLIGSQAIQLITLRKGFEQFTHDTEQKLALLRDVVRRVKAGEDVDVERELGTGDSGREKEWEEVMRELESEDELFKERSRERRKRERAEERAGG